ncbi:MAG: 1-deoxy-D-xylulose-5-phosphate reductoisomerase [Rhodospirillales bacterium]|nr:1-deoxy-D-xylulose-5-phosphate reductoisomerase [Rhodospirillales bacterium]
MAVATRPAGEESPAPKKVTVLGSTGSIGSSTLDLIGRNPESFVVEALTANRRVDELVRQALAVRPRIAVVADEGAYQDLRAGLSGSGIEVAAGKKALVEAAQRPVDIVMAAIVGAAGLEPTMAAAKRGYTVALANKESLVCAGDLMMREVERSGGVLLPVDSEHNAIFQVLELDRIDQVEKIFLTASGGPFRTFSREQMVGVSPEQAVAHPNWSMGAKISIDSATMMNKGLELIEAVHLFKVSQDRIEILVHPQSVVHSLVAYEDGSVLAQMGTPDMRTPISYALAWPHRMRTPSQRLDLAEIAQLTFERPDSKRFPALTLAREALKTGGGAPTILNASNEVAVQAFLEGKLGFLDITRVVEETLGRIAVHQISSIADVHHLDDEARRVAGEFIAGVAA